MCSNGKGIKQSVNDYMTRNRGQLEQFNKNLMHMNDKQAWRHILKYGKNMTRDILNSYSRDIREEVNKKIKRPFNKFIHCKFKKLTKSNKNKPINENNNLNNFTLAKPVIKYRLNEVAGSGPIIIK